MIPRALAVPAVTLATLVTVAAAATTATAADRESRTLTTALPIVAIDTKKRIGETKKVTATMRVVDRGRGHVNRLRDRPNAYRGPIGIETRGSSSQVAVKPQYTFETRTSSGKNNSVSLLGMPKENDWVLAAPYGDLSLMRSVLAYRFSNAMGRYASRTRYVELILNGRYEGVYVLMEKLKIDKQRVDARAGGGAPPFLLELSSEEKTKPRDEVFRLPVTGLPVKWTDPELDDLEPTASENIVRRVSAAESALHAPAFADPRGGYASHLDLPSDVDYVLINELFKNRDAFRHSVYMHGGADMKLRLGPVWDFDISSGKPRVPEAEAAPQGWITPGLHWADRLWADPAFVRALAARWRKVRAAGLPDRIAAWAAAHERELRGAHAREYERWAHAGSFAREVDHLTAWMDARIAWIDDTVDQIAPR